MLVTGIFRYNNEMFTTYEINEAGFYRFDMVRDSANFQTDIDAVVYSQVHRKKTYSIGNVDIYENYLKLKETVMHCKKKSTTDSYWEDNEFVVRTKSVSVKDNYTMETIHRNGNLSETTIEGPGFFIYTSVTDPIYGVKLEPLNFSEYVAHAVDDSVVDEEGNVLFHSMDYLKRRFDIAHLDSMDFVVATDVATFRKRLQDIKTNPCPFRGFDTETTGTDVCMYGDDYMVGVIVGHDEHTSTYFPFRHTGDFNLPMECLKELMDYLMTIPEKLVAHNKQFDRQVMLKEGYDLLIKWDTMLLSIILNPIIKKGVHALKYLMQELNGKVYLELVNIFLNKKDIDFSVLPVDIIKYYACPDATSVITLLKHQLTQLPKFQYRLAFLECDLADLKADQEYYGIRVDVKKYERQYKNCNYILERLLEAFRILTAEDGNINSPNVLLNLLYNKMKCKVLLRTQKGQPSTSSAAIKKLASVKTKQPHQITEDIKDLYGNTIIKASELANSMYPALVILAKYREYNKLKTAFYARFERTMKTGRIFFWINQNGAATGRQSSPMHQLPPALKEVILADTDYHDFWGPDFSQIELRMIAYLAGETELIELAKNPDNDIHRIIGSLISNKEMWAITPEERSTGKRRNFGVVYLISAMGLAGQIFGPGYTTENVAFCQQQLDDFYKHFKRIDRYIKRNAYLVKKNGYMQTAWYNRRRLFPEVFDENIEPRKLASVLRMANNVPVQGTAADYMKLAEVQMYARIREKGWNKLVDGYPLVRVMLSAHDEAIISAHQSIPYEEIIAMITECMETPVEGAPPFFVQPARMTNWADHSDDSVAMPIRLRDKVIADYYETGKSVFKNSYFELVIPDDIKAEMNKETVEPVKSIVKRTYQSCKLIFKEGDYVTEATDEHLKEAVFNYVESSRTRYRVDNYKELLNNFRTAQLDAYMKDLIAKYGTDYKIVGEKVRHPSLTHSLLEVYHEDLKGKDLTHEERITEATRMFIEEMLSKADKQTSFMFKLDVTENKESDKDKFETQLSTLVQYDANGEVIFESEEEEESFDEYESDDPDIESLLSDVFTDITYVWELGDTISFDCQELTAEDVNRVLSYIYEHQDSKGFYKVKLIYSGKLIDTKMRLESLNYDEANNLIKRLVEGYHVVSV